MSNTYFVTGALGCIGAWVVKHLVDRGDTPVVFDVGGDPRRIRDILDEEAYDRVKFVVGDITDLDVVKGAVADAAPSAIVHLAGLQVPFCKADPALGARVKVVAETPDGPFEVHRLVGSDGSFGASSLQQEIGLARATAIREVVVDWPASGTRQRFENLAVNRTYKITEGEAKPMELERPPLALAPDAGE